MLLFQQALLLFRSRNLGFSFFGMWRAISKLSSRPRLFSPLSYLHLMFASSFVAFPTMSKRVQSITTGVTPLQVVGSWVRAIVIYVVDLWKIIGVWNKRQSNESMSSYAFIFRVVPEHIIRIPSLLVDICLKDVADTCTKTGLNSFYPTKIANFVSILKPRNWYSGPSFSHGNSLTYHNVTYKGEYFG